MVANTNGAKGKHKADSRLDSIYKVR